MIREYNPRGRFLQNTQEDIENKSLYIGIRNRSLKDRGRSCVCYLTNGYPLERIILEEEKMGGIKYANTNKHLYDDIDLWEKTEGVNCFKEMPLNGNESPIVVDFGYGYGQYLYAASYAYPKGTIYGIDCNPVCHKLVSDKIKDRGICNIILINKKAEDLMEFQSHSIDLMLLYDTLHGSSCTLKYMLLQEAQRIVRPGGCLSILPCHPSNWRDRQGNKKKYTPKMIIDELSDYGFRYEGSCKTKGIHWEKCHTPYYIQKGNITFDILERIEVMNFTKK
jgi:ubiquinone/menaquinone biosynthesis C-methylase UbiE